MQVEINPVWQQHKLREFCREKGIQLCAYSPLGAKGTHWGSDSVMDSGVLHEIAKSKGKTVAQARTAFSRQPNNRKNYVLKEMPAMDTL